MTTVWAAQNQHVTCSEVCNTQNVAVTQQKCSNFSSLTSGSRGIWISLLKYTISLALLKKVFRLCKQKQTMHKYITHSIIHQQFNF